MHSTSRLREAVLGIVSGGTAAVPVRSVFQTDAVALKMVLQASFGMRASHVAWVQNTTW
jgi:hypothetical protein